VAFEGNADVVRGPTQIVTVASTIIGPGVSLVDIAVADARLTLPPVASFLRDKLTIRDRTYTAKASPHKVVPDGAERYNEGVSSFQWMRRNGGVLVLEPDRANNRWVVAGESNHEPPRHSRGVYEATSSGGLPFGPGVFYLCGQVFNARAIGPTDQYGRSFSWSCPATAGNRMSIQVYSFCKWETGGKAVFRCSINDLTNVVAGVWLGNGTTASHLGATDTPGAKAYAGWAWSTRRGDSGWVAAVDNGANNPGTPTTADTGIPPIVGEPHELVIEWFRGHAIMELYDSNRVLVYQVEEETDAPPDGTSVGLIFGVYPLAASVRTIYNYHCEVWVDQ